MRIRDATRPDLRRRMFEIAEIVELEQRITKLERHDKPCPNLLRRHAALTGRTA